MKLSNTIGFGLVICSMVLIMACQKPQATELLLNGEFDNEQAIGPAGSYNAFDQWEDWHVDFVNNSGGFGSVFVNQDPGHGEDDFKRMVCWAKGNYTIAVSQQVAAPAGKLQASVALLLGSGNYTKVALKLLGADGKTVLAQIDKPQDLNDVSEDASNNNTNWQIITLPIELKTASDLTYMVDINLAPGGINPYVRMDDASLKTVVQ